ncbi:MAG: amidohydrolase family protein, partial [Anaerolineae bacterium]
MFDRVIANGTLVTADATTHADLGISQGRIAAIGKRLAGLERIDASGMLVLPGAIDEHVHLQMPVGEFSSSDDFFTGTVAAAHGGTTTIIDFVEPEPDQSLRDALDHRRAEAKDKVVLDYGLHMTLSQADDQTLAQIPATILAGSASFKLYMAYEGLRLDDAGLLRALAALRLHGGRVLVHAENHHAIA